MSDSVHTYNSYPQTNYQAQYATSNFGPYSNGYPRYSQNYGAQGYSNQYSNTYSKPMPQNFQNPQLPPPTIRQDVWGLLNGFQALINVFYAGTGIVHFGKIFIKMTLKLMKSVFGKSTSTILNLLGFGFVKKMMAKSPVEMNWTQDFASEGGLEDVWKEGQGNSKTSKGWFGKIIWILRVCSMIGTAVALVLKSRTRQQHPVVKVESVGPEEVAMNLDNEAIKLQNSTDLDEEIKLIEQEKEDKADEIMIQAQDEVVNKEDFETVLETVENSTLKLLEAQIVNSSLHSLDNEESKVDEQSAVKSQGLPNETMGVLLDTPTSNLEYNTNKQEEPARIVSEDFWKNKETFEQIESLKKEEIDSAQDKKFIFEVPSVLQTLREKPNSSANKPWLMKKKKVVE